MAMRIILLYFILCFSFCTSLFGNNHANKVIKMHSLLNENIQFSIKTDYTNNSLTINIKPNEYEKISNFNGFVTYPTVIDGKFLFCHLRIKGGSGVKIERSVIFCVLGGNLYKAFDVLSKDVYVPLNSKKEIGMNVDILQIKAINKSYLLILNIRDNELSNQIKSTRMELKFNQQQHVFCQDMIKINGQYSINNERREVFIDEYLPYLEINKQKYIILNNNWFFLGNNQKLTTW